MSFLLGYLNVYRQKHHPLNPPLLIEKSVDAECIKSLSGELFKNPDALIRNVHCEIVYNDVYTYTTHYIKSLSNPRMKCIVKNG